MEVEFLLDQHQHQEVCSLEVTREFGVQPMINFQALKGQLNGDSSLIQHFGTILILELLYGNGTSLRRT